MSAKVETPLPLRDVKFSGDTCQFLSIDAWADGDGGWSWNNWFRRGEVPIEIADLPARRMLRWLRRSDLISYLTAGSVRVDDDQYNLVICDRHSGEPLFAVEYGNVNKGGKGGPE